MRVKVSRGVCVFVSGDGEEGWGVADLSAASIMAGFGELYSNNISGPIPGDLGNLTSLVSLDLYLNSFTGPIPESLGKLSKLRFLRLNNNSLTGRIPMPLTNISSLQVLDLSNNRLSGVVPDNGSFSMFTPISFANNLDLCGPVTGHPCPVVDDVYAIPASLHSFALWWG
ncbi:hypothetical protein GH714_023930 [Hevea brasiliensis]|uniref:Leucine-rich repeat-containing N-terminal plant-type domain-containing protein n=1 Tax=Hevea brasiliensis TaxID=3981 RepID=A0A6A6LBS4_HEVBR|nr:hypothetical protein GH714_023930 [Hevea brasiliensis]